jgi:hypothetical protein
VEVRDRVGDRCQQEVGAVSRGGKWYIRGGVGGKRF